MLSPDDLDKGEEKILLKCRKYAEITNVKELKNFDDTMIIFETVDGGILYVEGKDMRVTELVPESGRAVAEGNITGIFYEDGPRAAKRWFRKK